MVLGAQGEVWSAPGGLYVGPNLRVLPLHCGTPDPTHYYYPRLWIHAGSKASSPEEIQHMETFYTKRSGGSPGFPHHYPTSCLLGSVDVTDCLAAVSFLACF